MESIQRLSRRRFLKRVTSAAVAGVAAPSVVPARVLGRDGQVPPSEMITLGAIGLGFAWQAGLAFDDVRLLVVVQSGSIRESFCLRGRSGVGFR